MIKEDVVKYLKNKYHPKAIIIYGSYVDGSFDESSDIDVIVIADGVKGYDSELIEGIILDAWIYPTSYFENDYILDHNLQKVYDGDIVFDENGIAKELKTRAIDYINNLVSKTLEEIKQELLWCEKFLHRAERGDGDGYYRWHRLLVDSIKIYCDIKKMYYYGPKKVLLYMKNNDPEGFLLYNKALKELNITYLKEWIEYLKKISN